jgi:two-component system chemotaxis response regulator CheB
MGHDGRAGARAIKAAGGAVVIQDKQSSVVHGMPGAVMECGAYDRMGSLEEITSILKGALCA